MITQRAHALRRRGERKFEHGESGENIHRLEAHYGEFKRSFTLPRAVDADKINAECKDGVLHLRLKRPEAKPKQIEIKVK